MNVIEDYKPINFTYYNPRTSLFKAGKSDRERTTVYFCNNVESCDAYKRGKCVMLNGLYSHSCPYGKIERQEGYTKAARSCGVLISNAPSLPLFLPVPSSKPITLTSAVYTCFTFTRLFVLLNS